jgi:putative spermidine/putrescine transport system substrate-binding protein
VHRTRSRVATTLAVATLLLGTAASPLTAQSPGASEGAAPANPTSVEGYGGLDALVEAAKAEGALNVIALDPTWANYAEVLATFKAQYPEITVTEDQPAASSAEEITAVQNLAGTDAAPDVLDLGAAVAAANTALFAPYMNAAWADIPDNVKEPTGLYVSDYTGYMSIGCDVGTVPLPATVADLLKPEYAGMVALNGNPTQAGSGFNGVVMAALANGGSADDIAPGVAFFNQLAEAGNLLIVDPTPATIASGETPCVIDWEYNNAAQTGILAGQIDWQVVVPSDAPPVAAYYQQAINAAGPNPAAARLWQEYLYTPEAQNAWLRGFARPVLLDKMIADGTVDEEALGKLAEASGEPVVLTQDQVTAASAYLAENWDIPLP